MRFAKFVKWPQLQAANENGFRELIRILANSLRTRPEGIMVKSEVLEVLDKVCDLKGVRLTAVLQEENFFRILSDEAAMAFLARKIPRK